MQLFLRRSFAGRLWLPLCFIAALIYWGVGGQSASHNISSDTPAARTTVAIEKIAVGHRAAVKTPHAEEDLQFGEDVDPATWRHLKLIAHKQTGS